ncbi:MarR family winged helix-turn-helix transcriptional regulator [Corynebacterium tapiri]|uniref:MarR family transcriptional regulator n=1 Tax=Corynebacterium tapiri TaxID=1448266 RepID=A0A5C4U258_9CORY|nr:MarR family transcriptional regulator [Corynebacterium tapiri]TNL96027.1 MarR family transcriptional regulator [Corynebacterium tapiri]
MIPDSLLNSPLFQLERLRRRTRDAVEAALSTKDLGVRAYWTLSCLVEADAASQASLSEALGIDASDIVRLIDALEQRGWAKRERDPKDRRRQIVTASKKGRKAHAELLELVNAAELEALGEDNTKQLKHVRKLAKAVED